MLRQLILLAALCGIASASLFTELEYQNEFTNWMVRLGRMYTASEFFNRFRAFKDNMDFIKNWNKNGLSTVLGNNELSDLTNEEYRRFYLGFREDYSERLSRATTVKPTSAPTTPLPASINWATLGAVTPVKNQGQCGSCYSFSATGATEGAYFLKTGKLVSLSEQNIIDCTGSTTTYKNLGCNGGDMVQSYKYIIANKGIDTAASYPYKGAVGTCAYNAANSGATLTSFAYVTSGSESALKTAVASRPVAVAIDAGKQSFQLYKSGVYYESTCSSTTLNHGVLAVGYGTTGTSDYWIVKNSWGTSWGQAGYIWMARNKNNNCGIATRGSYPIA